MLKGGIRGFGISILIWMIPIVHFLLGPVSPFIGGFIGAGSIRATPGQALGIGVVIGSLWAAGPASVVLLDLGGDTLQTVFTWIAVGLGTWATVLGSVGALLASGGQRRVVVMGRRWEGGFHR
jgi:hypothetical protein